MSTILLVDDDILFQQAIVKQVDFARVGFDRVLTATDAPQAMTLLRQEPVDILLCDIEMPGQSGLDLIRWVSEQDLPVIVLLLTCHPSFDYAKEAIALKVFDYLLKPIRIEDLEEQLQQALKKKAELLILNDYKTKKPKRGREDPVGRIRDYIEAHIETELTREQLGKALFMNPDYVARIFREKQGQSLNDYIRNRRIARAKKLLRETDLPLSDICALIGYSYNTYFFNTFKKATGVSPNDYRSKNRKTVEN